MNRREFLKRASSATALALVTGGTGWYFHDRERHRYEPSTAGKASFVVPDEAAVPKVTLARNQDPSLALRAALDAIGGIKRFVQPGQKVTIKPNIGWDRAPEQAANTNPVLVSEMVRMCLAAGAAAVIVSDISCNEPRRCFLRSGIRAAAEQAGAKVILPADEDYITTDIDGKLLTSWPVLRHFLQCDRLINMPIVKQHSLPGCTIGLKNLYGILGGHRNQLHQEIDRSIVDLAAFCRPSLTVVDATHVLLRGGPQGGSLDDVATPNAVICATDPVAADSRGVEFLGRTGAEIGHIVLADKEGLGQLDYRKAGYQEVV